MPKRKQSAVSLKNLKPGANLKHGAFQFLRTGKIPPGDKDIADEAKRLRKELMEAYCPHGNYVLQFLQPIVINQLVSAFTFSEILWRHLWSSAARAKSGDDLQKSLTQSGWTDLSTADNRIIKGFRDLNRNLKDFRLGRGKNTSLDDYLERTYGDKAKKEKRKNDKSN